MTKVKYWPQIQVLYDKSKIVLRNLVPEGNWELKVDPCEAIAGVSDP